LGRTPKIDLGNAQNPNAGKGKNPRKKDHAILWTIAELTLGASAREIPGKIQGKSLRAADEKEKRKSKGITGRSAPPLGGTDSM